jgi:hypothetical protein
LCSCSNQAAPAGTPAPYVNVGSVPYIPTAGGNRKHPPPPVHVSSQPASAAIPDESRPEFSEDDFKQVIIIKCIVSLRFIIYRDSSIVVYYGVWKVSPINSVLLALLHGVARTM